MANESSFYGDITFYHKGLEDTPENREKFKKIIEEFCEIYPGYYGNTDLGSSDIEIDEDFDYVHSEPLSFTSIGRWSYENSFKWILSFSQKDIKDASAKMPITNGIRILKSGDNKIFFEYIADNDFHEKTVNDIIELMKEKKKNHE